MICSFGSKGRVVKEEELKTDMDQLIAIKTEVMRTIRQVPDPELQLLLEKRYLYHEKLEDIAIDMNISIQHTFRLHGEALKKEEANGKTFDYGWFKYDIGGSNEYYTLVEYVHNEDFNNYYLLLISGIYSEEDAEEYAKQLLDSVVIVGE